MRRCLIFGAGEPCDGNRLTKPYGDDVVIAADGGYAWTCQEGIEVKIVLGDMDSLGIAAPTEKSLVFPVEKDDTDMGLAVAEGRNFGCKEFFLYGGTGGRSDHTLANYQLLVNIARRGERGYLVDSRMTALALCDGKIRIRGRRERIVSVFAMDTEVYGVSLSGLQYPLTDATLQNAFALGVSNHFAADVSEISVKKGTLLVLGEYLPSDVEWIAGVSCSLDA